MLDVASKMLDVASKMLDVASKMLALRQALVSHRADGWYICLTLEDKSVPSRLLSFIYGTVYLSETV